MVFRLRQVEKPNRMSTRSIGTSTIWLKLECERMRSVIITSVDGTALARERLRRLVLFARLAQGAIGYDVSGGDAIDFSTLQLLEETAHYGR